MFHDIFRNKKVLVTGHTGFKGSWLCSWLKELGAEVTGLSLYIPSNPSHFEVLNLKRELQDLRLDINSFESVLKTFQSSKPDIVFHMAAQPIVSEAIANPVNNFSTNVMGTVHVLEAIRQTASVKSAVMITSDKCYENVEWEFGYREVDRLGGKDPYSASKACAEIAFHSYFRTYLKEVKHLNIATARAGNVIGGGDWAKDRIVPDTVQAWGRSEKPLIRSPHATRPWQHVLEPLSGYLWLAALLLRESIGLNGESFNFGPAANVNATVEQLLTAMTKFWPNRQWQTKESTLTKKEAGLLKLNCDKALARLGWEPTMTFHETVEFTALWYKNYYEGSGSEVAALTNSQIHKYTQMAHERGMSWAQ